MKKSVGFNWGPSAVSTTYWTGFRLSDLLKHCGAKTPLEGARYVHFKGVEKELPQVRIPFSFGCCPFRVLHAMPFPKQPSSRLCYSDWGPGAHLIPKPAVILPSLCPGGSELC